MIRVMLDELEWPSLEARRDRSSLLLFHKIHSGAVSIEEKDKHLTPAHSLNSTRASHSAQYCRYQTYSGARGPRFDSRSRREKFRCPNTLSLVSFAGMTLDKCIVLRIRTLTGCPLCRESHPLCRLKNPTVISIWLLVGFHPATRSVQSTPADNTRKRVWQYIEKERKKALKNSFFPRTIPRWNSLFPLVVNSQTTEEFRALLI